MTVAEPSGAERSEQIKVNHPIVVDGAKIYLQGNGFAPEITVHDAEGEVAFSGRVTFIPEDTMYTSRGVVKVPDVSAGLDQIGLVGYFLPTAEVNEDGSARSAFPQPVDPLLVLEVYTPNRRAKVRWRRRARRPWLRAHGCRTRSNGRWRRGLPMDAASLGG